MSLHVADEPWDGEWGPGEVHAAFKEQVAACTRNDPVPTLERLSEATAVPAATLARYALVRWCAEGSESLLALGPRTVEGLWTVIAEAEDTGTDDARLAAYEALRGRISWLRAPLTEG